MNETDDDDNDDDDQAITSTLCPSPTGPVCTADQVTAGTPPALVVSTCERALPSPRQRLETVQVGITRQSLDALRVFSKQEAHDTGEGCAS
jgi:hypothetical protein